MAAVGAIRARREARERRRAREFEAFTAGAAGRLLHAAALLTGDPDEGERLLVTALARTYADWFRLRGEDPYARTSQELAACFSRRAWRYRRPRGGLLDRLPPRERLVLVLRLYEGVAEEQAAAQLGLPAERVRTLCMRAVATMRSTAPLGGRPVTTPDGPPGRESYRRTPDHRMPERHTPDRHRPDRHRPDRKVDEVQRMLEAPHPPAPPDLADRAMERGRRLMRRRRLLRTTLWTLLAAAALSAAVLAFRYWSQPATVAPPMRDW